MESGVYEPLNKRRRMKIFKNISWAAFGLAMLIGSCSKDYGYNFENGYNTGNYEDTVSVNIDTDRFKIDYSKYTQARLFPGLMSEDEPRLENFLVQIDLAYEDIRNADLRIQVAPEIGKVPGYTHLRESLS